MKSQIQIIVLAAGHGKRMNNHQLPKVLLPLKGKPVIQHLLTSITKSQICPRPIIVVGKQADLVKHTLGITKYKYVYQSDQLGTGHAVACCRKLLKKNPDNIMVLYGDMPYLKPGSIRKLAGKHIKGKKVLTLATVTVPNFKDWRQCFAQYGRIIRNYKGEITEIIEVKDASLAQLNIKEVNPSYFCFKAEWLWQNLDRLNNYNTQKEYYLTDLVYIAIDQGQPITSIPIQPEEAIGINTPEQLQLAKKVNIPLLH